MSDRDLHELTELTELTELLDSTAPDRPDLAPDARTSAVTARARTVTRRRRGLVAAAVVAVVGAGVAVPLTLGGDDDAGPGFADDPAVDAQPAPCPAEPVDVEGAPPATLPDGAASARLCPATWSQATEPSTLEELPAAPLTGTALDDLLARLGDLPVRSTLPNRCASILIAPNPWALVISTDDGEATVIGSTVRLCGTVSIGGADHAVDDVLGAVVAAG